MRALAIDENVARSQEDAFNQSDQGEFQARSSEVRGRGNTKPLAAYSIQNTQRQRNPGKSYKLSRKYTTIK